MTEAEWQRQVIDLARMYGWRVYHTFDSRRSSPGWPDLVLARAPVFMVVELKTDKGRVRPAQREWLELLAACGVEAHIWRPRDVDAVLRRLVRR